MNRRQFNQLALAIGSGLSAELAGCQTSPATVMAKEKAVTPEPLIDYGKMTSEEAKAASEQAHHAFMAVKDGSLKMMGEEKIAMIMYPGLNSLDLIAPQYIFASMMGAKVYLISSNDNLEPVANCFGFAMVPTHTFKECPDNLDILFVPGGAMGTVNAVKNVRLIEFIKHKARSAKYVTSVCTGSHILGKAGLLKGKRATSHWTTLDMLARHGAIPIKERVVWDGNVTTGGGVTAGIDFGLQIVAALRGKQYAETIQLDAEYNPLPPYNSGSPDTASPFVRDNLKGIYAPFLRELEEAI